MLRLLVIFVLLGLTCAYPLAHDLNGHWETYKKIHNKLYSATEEPARRLIWEDNLARVIQHNIEADLKKHSYKIELNQLSDMTTDEINRKLNGFGGIEADIRDKFQILENISIPDEVDWTKKGLVTPVKDQGKCSSCWAFSSTGSLEGQHKKKTGDLLSLSEQNLIDCSSEEGNNGCKSGLMDNAFRYILKNRGIATEVSYPYEEKQGPCRFKKSDVGATLVGIGHIPRGDEIALQQAVATVGPISVLIDASPFSFHHYSYGIYDEKNCSNTEYDHAVLIVGYGTEHDQDYWLVKNSWGTIWGSDGYIKMSRNKGNQCGIANFASYPIV